MADTLDEDAGLVVVGCWDDHRKYWPGGNGVCADWRVLSEARAFPGS